MSEVHVVIPVSEDEVDGMRIRLDDIQVHESAEAAAEQAQSWAESADGEISIQDGLFVLDDAILRPDVRMWFGHPPARPNGDLIDPDAEARWAYVLQRQISG